MKTLKTILFSIAVIISAQALAMEAPPAPPASEGARVFPVLGRRRGVGSDVCAQCCSSCGEGREGGCRSEGVSPTATRQILYASSSTSAAGAVPDEAAAEAAPAALG